MYLLINGSSMEFFEPNAQGQPAESGANVGADKNKENLEEKSSQSVIRLGLLRLVVAWWKGRKRPSYEFQFDPKEDITAWENAQIVPLMIPNQHINIINCLAELPQTALRHIKLEGCEVTVEKIQELKESSKPNL